MKKRFFQIFSNVCLLVHAIALGFICNAYAEIPPESEWKEAGICARVRIQISQDVTLTRTAFQATLEITNAPENVSLEAVRVTLDIRNETQEVANALFGLPQPILTGISDLEGGGSIEPGSSAKAVWTITPTRDAAPLTPISYTIGGTLSYVEGGAVVEMPLLPATILVRPDPRLVLNYFMPRTVYGDDPFTEEIEPAEPFPLGLIMTNEGHGTAYNVSIASSQPKIIENEKGLLIDFKIIGSKINTNPGTSSLTVNLGNIGPGQSSVAEWLMTSTLQGKFIEYKASFEHVDDLGSPKTSIMDSVSIHEAIHAVRADFPEDDGRPDFLANDVADENFLPDTLYKSDGSTAPVSDVDGVVSGSLSGELQVTLTAFLPSGWVYVRADDPGEDAYRLVKVVRSDGREARINDNAWTTHRTIRLVDYPVFRQHLVHLFDYSDGGSYQYTLTYEQKVIGPQAPIMQFIPDRTVAEGERLGFIIQASDPNGTIPILSASPVPQGATFTDRQDGTGLFDWRPTAGQSGTYTIRFIASDGELESFQDARIKITSPSDTDGDGMADAWEMQYFGTLDRDGTGDFDGDGISDLDEYLHHTDPTVNSPPTVPVITSPLNEAEVDTLTPVLSVVNSTDLENNPINYDFELSSDAQFSISKLVASARVQETDQTTSFTVPEDKKLTDNTWYWWRVRSTDGASLTEWAYGSFFVNTENDPPAQFQASSPADDAQVATLMPRLEVTNTTDPDGDKITYGFRVFASATDNAPVASISWLEPGQGGVTGWTVTSPLNDNTWYYWDATATDEHGLAIATPRYSFFVNTVNNPPTTPQFLSPADRSEVTSLSVDLVAENAADVDGDLLTYFFECDLVSTFDSPAKFGSGSIPGTTWNVSNLKDNSWYFCRVKASDGYLDSPSWAQTSFFVNTENDPPTTPTLKNPGNGAWVTSLTPQLEVNPSTDLDGDTLTYKFELYSDSSLSTRVFSGESDATQWTVPEQLSYHVWHYWRAQAVDEHGAPSEWMAEASFFTDENGTDDPPAITLLEPATDVFTNGQSVTIEWDDSDPDSNAIIDLYNKSVQGTTDAFAEGISEDPDGGTNDSYIWDVAGIPDGVYRVYATISDGTNSVTSYAKGSVTIDRVAPVVQASPASGSYSSPQSVVLSANEPATIYYTLDESTPSQNSAVYTNPIQVRQNTTIKFMAVDLAGNVSGVITETYAIAPHTYPWIYGSGSLAVKVTKKAPIPPSFDMDVTDSALPAGYLNYSDPKSGLNLKSAQITRVSIAGNTATITGKGTVNNSAGYSFTASVVDGSPDKFQIKITKPNGKPYYSIRSTNVATGGLAISTK